MTLKNSIYLLSNKRAIFILFFCWSLFSLAQSDSTSKLELHSPKKAAIYSAILPGLGQIYNKKYWKLPIVYGALGGTIYSITWNQTQYQRYRQERKYRFDNNTVQNIELQLLSDANLIELETYYKKWRDFSSIMF